MIVYTPRMQWWGAVRSWAGAVVRQFVTMTGGPGYLFDSAPKPIADLLADLNTLSERRVSRDVAVSVPAVLRGRNEVCSIATLPLMLRRGIDPVDHPLFRQIDPDVPNVITMTRTIEDLIFEGLAWWQKTSLDFDGYPLSARYVPVGKVSVDPPRPKDKQPPGRWVWVDGVRTPMSEMIRFDSPNPALLTAMARTVRRAVLLDKLASTYADNPRPLDYFTDTDDPSVTPFTDEEIGPFLARWRSEVKRSTTAWMPSKVRRVDVSAPSPLELQLVELQRQVTIEIANALGVDPEDLGVSTTSRTYFNATDRRISKINEGRRPIMKAMTDRLTMGDVTRRGYTVVFDLSEYLEADPASQATYWEALQRMGVVDAAWIRTQAKIPGPPPREIAAPAAPALTAGRPAIHVGDITPRPAPDTSWISGGYQVRGFAGEPAHTFSVVDFAGSVEPPTTDTAKRTISGLALPYNVIGRKFGIAYRFKPGSLEYDGNVKHFKDHMTPVGAMTRAVDGKDGFSVELSVLSGVDGSPEKTTRDQLLYDAEAGLYNGLSVGVDFELFDQDGNPVDATWDETDRVWDVHRATLREVSSTPMPVMQDARVTSVAASLTGGHDMNCPHCGHRHAAGIACATYAASLRQAQLAAGYTQPAPQPAPQPNPQPSEPPTTGIGVPMNVEQFAQWAQANGLQLIPNAAQIAQPVNANPQFSAQVTEPSPYRFDRKGNLRKGSHDFSSDLFEGWKNGDLAARDRAQSFVEEVFADGTALAALTAQNAQEQFAVTSGNVSALNPNRNRPDLYVDQMDYTYPLWEAINKGTLEDITPFVVPKYNTSAGLVAAHVEGTEPTPGSFTATSQTITPTAVSGKIEYTREAFDQGGNPQASGLIWTQMTRAYYEALEAGAQAFFTAQAASITDITITTAAADATLDQSLADGIIPLNFIRGGNRFRKAFTQIDLFKAMAKAKDTAGRRLYPELGPQNAVGTTDAGYRAIQAHGVTWLPAWATAATGSVAASSWMFDPDGVAGWATAPQKIDITWRVAWVDIGLFGYKATALLDANKVREVVYDPV